MIKVKTLEITAEEEQSLLEMLRTFMRAHDLKSLPAVNHWTQKLKEAPVKKKRKK